MSADTSREAYVTWDNENDEEETAVVPVYGHADFGLVEWGLAFRRQHPQLAAPLPDGSYRAVYIELDIA